MQMLAFAATDRFGIGVQHSVSPMQPEIIPGAEGDAELAELAQGLDAEPKLEASEPELDFT